MIKEIVKSYKKFSLENGWTQRIAAEKVGCSIQHINRIFNEKCLPSAVLAAKMEEVMGKPKSSGLEECMEKYPIGSKFITVLNGIENFYTEEFIAENGNKDYNKVIQELAEDDYYLGKRHGGYNILFYMPKKGFFFQEFLLTTITGYYTNDGCIFKPFLGVKRSEIFILDDFVFEDNFLDNPHTIIKSDLSNLKEIIKKIFNNYNQINKKNYIPCFCEEDYKNALEKDKE